MLYKHTSINTYIQYMPYIHTYIHTYITYIHTYIHTHTFIHLLIAFRVCIYTNSFSYHYQAITKAMRTNKIDKPGKVYVVTKQTGGGGSMGNMTSSGKNKVR